MADDTSKSCPPVVIGIDLGTQGARALAVDLAGTVLASAAYLWECSAGITAPGWFEQSPAAWREAVLAVLHELTAALGQARGRVRSVGVQHLGRCASSMAPASAAAGHHVL